MVGAPEVYFLALVLRFESAHVLVGQGNMAWEETRLIHRFDDLSFAQEDKLLEQAVPAKTRVATEILDGKPPAKKSPAQVTCQAFRKLRCCLPLPLLSSSVLLP